MTTSKPCKSGLDRARAYIAGVLSGDIPAPETIKQACQRFESDLQRDDLYFDKKSANAAVRNIEKLSHAKGRWQGQPLVLEAFQCFVVVSLFGWKWKKSGLRRFRYAYIQMPRKNGKSLLAISIALLMFGPDMEPGAEIYLGATSQDQARDILFSPAKYIVNNSVKFRNRFGIQVNASAMVIPANFSQLKAVIKKPDDGTNPHCALVDEFHLHDTPEMWEVFDTGMGSRQEPLLLTTTTAGFSLGGPCHIYRDEMLKLLRGEYEDDRTFALIYEPDESDAWDDPDTLRKVNPNLNVSVSEDFLLSQLDQARRSAEKQNSYRTKHLCEWVGAKTAYLNMLAWRRQQTDLTIDDFRGEPCHVAVDLSTQKDAASVGAMFYRGGKYYYFAEHFVPEGAFEWNDRYKTFHLAGQINVSDGNAQDYELIENYIKELAGNHTVLSVRFDPWQAAQMMQRLMATGLTVYKQTQQFSDFSDPMKRVETAILDGDLFHGIDPVLTWMVGNTSVIVSKDGHMKPVKGNKNSPTCVIDGCVAMIMTMKGYQDEPAGSLDEWLNNPVAVS